MSVLVWAATTAHAAPTTFRVVDPDGAQVSGAMVEIAGKPLGMTTNGELVVFDTIKWRRGVEVSADGFVTVRVPRPRGREAQVVLEWLPIDVTVRVRTPLGERIDDAAVSVVEGDARATATADGVHRMKLPPGTWQVRVAAPGYGAQVRTMTLLPGQTRPADLEALLHAGQGEGSLVLRLEDFDPFAGNGARILVDGVPIGLVGGGTVVIEGLSVGEHRVTISAHGYRTLQRQVVAAKDAEAIDIALSPAPGSVRLVVRSDLGPVPDAKVRISGPIRRPPVTLGASGERTFLLGKGTWRVLVTSPSYGLQEREVVIDDDTIDLTVVVNFLQPDEGGQAHLLVRVVDPEGRPVDQAEVTLDGASYGQTSTGGTLFLSGLKAGERLLGARNSFLREGAPTAVSLVDGMQEAVVSVAWKPGTVRARARTRDAPVDDAVLRATGPAALDPVPLGLHGQAWLHLEPGDWSVVVTSQAWGIYPRDVHVPADHRALVDLDILMREDADPHSSQVVAPSQAIEVHSTPGAIVRLVGAREGSPRAAGPDGTAVIEAEPGLWQVLVEHPDGVAVGQLEVQPGSGRNRVTLPLDAGIVLRAQDATGRPLPAAVGGQRAPWGVFALQAGEAPITVTAEAHHDQTVPADHSRIVRLVPKPGRVSVSVRSADGPIPAAELRLEGPQARAPHILPSSGESTLSLPAGTWRILATAPEYGVRMAVVQIAPDTDAAPVAFVLEAPRVDVLGNEVRIRGRVHFDTGLATVRAESDAILDEVAGVLLANPDLLRVEVQGHTDTTGDIGDNMALSQARAEAVVEALVTRGVDPERLSARGYGPTRPVRDNQTRAGRQRNRRVQFEILER